MSAEHTTTYWVDVTTEGKGGQRGQYDLIAVLVEGPDEEFRRRALAQRLITETWLSYNAGTNDSRQRALEKGKEALTLLPGLGLEYYEYEMNYLIGDICLSFGNYLNALHFLNQALRHAQAAQLTQKQAEALTSIGQAHDRLGEYEDGLAAFRQALPLWGKDEYLETPVNLIGWTLLNIGATYNLVGEREQAIEYFNQSAARYREHYDSARNRDASGDDHEFHRGMVMVNNGLGTVYAKLGQKQKALEYFLEMRSEVEQTDWWYAQAQALNNIADVYVSLGEFQSAAEKYQEALDIARDAGEQQAEAEVLVSLGNYYRLTNDFTQASEKMQQALGVYRTIGAKGGQAIALTSLCMLLNAKDRLQEALPACQEALRLRREIGDRNGQGAALNELAISYESLGDPSQAALLFTQALDLRRSTGDREGEANTLYHLAKLARSTGNLEMARARIEASLSLTEAIRAGVLSQELRASYLNLVREYYEFYIDLLMDLHRQHPDQGYEAAALQASEMARGRLLLENLAEARANIRQGMPDDLLAQERGLQQRISAKAEYQFRLQSEPHSTLQRIAVAGELQDLTEELQTLQARIRALSPRYAALTQPQPLSAIEIQKQVLDGQTLLLEYALGKAHSYVWAVTPTSLKVYELPPQAEIEKLALRNYELLTARNETCEGETPVQRRERIKQADVAWGIVAGQLSRILVEPVEKDMAGKRLLIVGQGALQYIPFNALPIAQSYDPGQTKARRKGGKTRRQPTLYHPLIADHEIVVLPSASLLAQLRRENASFHSGRRSVAVFADPVFMPNDERVTPKEGLLPSNGREKVETSNAAATEKSDALLGAAKAGSKTPVQPQSNLYTDNRLKGMSIPRLFETRQEAASILAHLPPDQKFRALDFDANRETAIGPKLSQYQILHFATHALIDNLHPELSGIILSLVDRQGQPQNGFLRAHEIYNLRLPVELVVLSACQTGLGKELKGEGLLSLTHSFMYAGAAHVAVSLWEVDDKATADLMAAFYQDLLSPKQPSAAAALRFAQTQAWRSRRWPSPYFWAGFILQGDWR